MDTNINSPAETKPHPFSEIPGLWVNSFQMDEAFFNEEAPRASAGNTLLALVIFSVVSAVISILQQQFGLGVASLESLLGGAQALPNIGIPLLTCIPIVALVSVLLGYYFGVMLMHIGAMIFHGAGSYMGMAYLLSLYYVPLGTLAALASLVPCVGSIIALAIGIYQIVLTVRAIKVNYHLTIQRAMAAFFLPSGLLVLIPLCAILVLVLSVPGFGEIFSKTIQSLTPTP
jgi:hypothetical protein